MRCHRLGVFSSFLMAAIALAVVGLAWGVGPPASGAQSGSMVNCPQAGKWAISVWDGASGTAAADALATCGAGAVDAAYALDPQTGGWLGWFAGRPEISTLATLNDMQGVLALGSATGPVVTPTPTPTATPSGEYSFTFASSYSEPDTFRGTVEEIRMMDSIPKMGYHEGVTAPAGSIFAVVLMRVENIGTEPDDVGSYSFRLRDSLGRHFTLSYDEPDSLNVQWAAEDYFQRIGVYDDIQPGITRDMVFGFLVPTAVSGLVAERCPTDGC
ncbi:MAG: hypothetical protein Q8P22_06010 [Chloroflexota bacterium]|nr:hypothetical protein [Chloroflexota bacterium]